MMRLLSFRLPTTASFTLAGLFLLVPAVHHRIEPRLLAGLEWRNVGPFRGGRVAAVSGVIGQPGVFYAGFPAAGVWKTTSAGETWYPIFDSIKDVSSIGAVEVAPSNGNVIYVGTGDLITGGVINEGNGVYKSIDAGATWRHVGLDATKQIPSILVDPNDPNIVLVAAQGDIHQDNDSRGVYRSIDGGGSWSKTLYVDGKTGIQKLARANDVPNVIFATTIRHYVAPPSAGPPPTPVLPDTARPSTRLYKSSDAGITWSELSGGGLPPLSGRTSVAVAMTTNAQRVFLVTNSGLYRSDDGGTTWRQMDAADERIRNGQGGYNCGVYVDPKNPDMVYVLSTSSYKSTDGGTSFTGFKGAPGGDDPQQLWIDPTNGQRMLMGVDQGATITMDGGATWSSWYNQSTEQIYHLSVDNSSPYWIYATQQDAGAIRTRGRGNQGAITPLDWNPVPGWEWGTILADPRNPNIVYASGNGLVKISYPSEQWVNVSPAQDPALKLRTTSSQPLAWAPWDSRELITGFQYVMTTTDGGAHWTKISPDFSVPPGVDTSARLPGTRGAIESISASTVTTGTIWISTNNGTIAMTKDHGKVWNNVSIPGLPNPLRALIAIDASHHDAGTAYAAVNLYSTGDYTPYFFRTRDYGKTWTKIIDGMPTNQASGSFAHVIRADPKKAGLLFAGTASAMYVSFDDGDHWQSMMFNLPNTSYRDIVIKGNDLLVATYGRGIFILDDFSVLRQLTPAIAAEPVHLFTPGDAMRTRRNVGSNTPFPPEVPHALNPRDGVALSYALASPPSGDLSLDVLDATGKLVRHLSSTTMAPVSEAARPPHPNFWLETPTPLTKTAGLNRAYWDLRYDAPPALTHSYEINANPGLTPPSPEGVLAPPGVYSFRLTVNGQTYSTRASVVHDPSSPATSADIAAQHALLLKIDEGMRTTWDGNQRATALRAVVLKAAGPAAPADVASAATAVNAELDILAGAVRGGPRGDATAPPSFVGLNNAFAGQINTQASGDMAPGAGALAGFASKCADLQFAVIRWNELAPGKIGALNAALAAHGSPLIPAPTRMAAPPRC